MTSVVLVTENVAPRAVPTTARSIDNATGSSWGRTIRFGPRAIAPGNPRPADQRRDKRDVRRRVELRLK